MNEKHYFVISPEITKMMPVMDDGSGPEETFCCVASVVAKTKRAAKIKALKHKDMQDWVNEQRSDCRNPFTGLKTEETKCRHGKCYCELCNENCEECEIEWENRNQEAA